MSRDERTRTYVAKRTAEGKTKKEIIRCLKRYIAREVYRILASLFLKKPPILDLDKHRSITSAWK
jgi:transposase